MHAIPHLHTFIGVWTNMFSQWNSNTPTPMSSNDLLLFINGLHILKGQGTFPIPILCPTAPTPPPPNRKVAAASARKARKVQAAERFVATAVDNACKGFLLIYTDGAAVQNLAAGYGIYSEEPEPRSLSCFVPALYHQTNNVAELLAVVTTLQLSTSTKIAVCTDSQYVIGGASGAVHRWKIRGWKGSNGLIDHVSLWEALIVELLRPGRTISFIKVLSHVQVHGNEIAASLAKRGMKSHPAYPPPPHPNGQVPPSQSLPPPPTRHTTTPGPDGPRNL